MKQLSFILLISLLTQVSCESTSSADKEIETQNVQKSDSSAILKAGLNSDSLVQDSNKVTQKEPVIEDTLVEEKDEQQEVKAINIEEAVDVNKHKNVRDDPDYIGTPCELIEGECIRHDHSE